MQNNHIAIIMDGNGRYAKTLGKIRSFGHYKGAKNIKNVIKYALGDGVKTLSLFAFSTENWDRPIDEVNYLLELLSKYIKSQKTFDFCQENDIRFVWKGFKDNKMSNDLIESITNLENATKNNQKLTLAILFNYGGQREIMTAINNAVENNEKVNESTINKYLITGDLGPIDLLIRTGGKHRISNFMLYNLAYAEIYFCDSYWPKFNKKDWNNAIGHLKGAVRTFGKVING